MALKRTQYTYNLIFFFSVCVAATVVTAPAQTLSRLCFFFNNCSGKEKMAMKALRGMMNGAINELSSAVSGSRPAPASTAAAAREHVMAVSRDYISQPRLSESVVHVCVCLLCRHRLKHLNQWPQPALTSAYCLLWRHLMMMAVEYIEAVAVLVSAHVG